MGRVKKYSGGQKHRRSKSLLKKKPTKNDDSDNADTQMADTNSAAASSSALSIGKRKQIFKKSKDGRREVKKQILELKRQTSKLRKRNLDQKSEKKSISKEIKKLRVSKKSTLMSEFLILLFCFQAKMRNCDLDENELGNESDQWEDVVNED